MKLRGAGPARFSGVAAHAVGDQRQRSGLAVACRQLQSPPGSQVERFAQLDHHQRHCARTQRLFGNRERIGLVLGGRSQQTGRIEDLLYTRRVKLRPLPGFAHPKHRPLQTGGQREGKKHRASPAGLMGAVLFGRVIRDRSVSHRHRV